MERDELAAWLRLTLTPGVGNATVRKLLAAFGLPQAVFAQSEQTLRHLVSAQQATALLDVPAGLETLAGRTWHWLEETDGDVQRRVATLGDATYPVSLLHIEDPPMLLYLMGQLALPAPAPAPAAIAIVGSRNPTPQGESNARQFAHAFAQAGLTVISGLALGIDGARVELAGVSARWKAQRPVATMMATGPRSQWWARAWIESIPASTVTSRTASHGTAY